MPKHASRPDSTKDGHALRTVGQTFLSVVEAASGDTRGSGWDRHSCLSSKPRVGTFLSPERSRINSGEQECSPLIDSTTGKNACPTDEVDGPAIGAILLQRPAPRETAPG